MADSKEFMEDLLKQVLPILSYESEEWRPSDKNGDPGGMVLLQPELPTIVVPDLHGRKEFLPDLMHFSYKDQPVYQQLKSKTIQIVCVGDGMHGERRVAARWRIALEEYKKGYEECPSMAEEMTENFQTMAMVMRLKITFPRLFHFLKGNHENILDEKLNGNHPFRKFAAEGPMTRAYVEKFFGTDFLMQYDRFEKNLPLMAVGPSFVITHARPKQTYPKADVINYRTNPDLIEGLTWTRNAHATPGSINEMFEEIMGNNQGKNTWIVGHNSLTDRYKVWEEESLIEIHNPNLRSIVILDPSEIFDPEKHITELPSQDQEGVELV